MTVESCEKTCYIDHVEAVERFFRPTEVMVKSLDLMVKS